MVYCIETEHTIVNISPVTINHIDWQSVSWSPFASVRTI